MACTRVSACNLLIATFVWVIALEFALLDVFFFSIEIDHHLDNQSSYIGDKNVSKILERQLKCIHCVLLQLNDVI